jgi:hypothetical protein
MTPSIEITAPPVVCTHCGREITYLFCVQCSVQCTLARLSDADIVALSRSIQRMSKSPIFKTRARTDCLLCGKAIPAGSTARLLAKHSYAHPECVCRMRARLDELLPKQEVASAGELPFGDAFMEIE